MRGKQSVLMMANRHQGITPAHAGKTKYYDKLRYVNKDHPRACGENGNSTPLQVRILGSPPRMRGKHK